MSKEDFQDLANAGKHILAFGSVFLLIAVLGSSVKAPGWAIPVGTLGITGLAYFADKATTDLKTRIKKSLVWGSIALAFTAISVLFS